MSSGAKQKTSRDATLEIATLMSKSGDKYFKKKKFKKALDNYEKALEIERKLLPPNSSRLATTLDNLAMVNMHLKELDKAYELHKESMAIQRMILIPKSVDLAQLFNHKALIYSDSGELDKSLELYEEALVLERKNLPPDSPYLADLLENIGNIHRRKDEFKRATQFFEESLAIKVCNFGVHIKILHNTTIKIETIKMEIAIFWANRKNRRYLVQSKN